MLIYSALIKRILAVFLTILSAVGAMKFPGGGTAGDTAKIEYRFDNTLYWSASGTVTVSSAQNGEYDLYWGDSDGDILEYTVSGNKTTQYSEFITVDVENGKGSAQVYSFTAIPAGAQTVVAYSGNTQKGKLSLPPGKITKTDSPVYSFGAISDVHFNRYSFSSVDDARVTMPNALSFFEGAGVKLVAVSGDLSSRSEDSAYIKFRNIASHYSFPVYSCTGNHDCAYNGSVNTKMWQSCINPGLYSQPRDEGIKEVAPNNLDFVYAPAQFGGDVFIFFNQVYWSYANKDSRIVTDEQLDWLEKILEKYKSKTVYLFFHTFLANCETLDPGTGEGNILTKSGVYYSLVYTVGTADEVRFRELMHRYTNVIFFNGHSHWKYEMGVKYNPAGNITNYGGKYATMVHLASVTSSRVAGDDDENPKDRPLYGSEGMLVKVYKDHIQYTAVDFMTGQILAYSTYATAK